MRNKLPRKAKKWLFNAFTYYGTKSIRNRQRYYRMAIKVGITSCIM